MRKKIEAQFKASILRALEREAQAKRRQILPLRPFFLSARSYLTIASGCQHTAAQFAAMAFER
jgi:hypothetical protein